MKVCQLLQNYCNDGIENRLYSSTRCITNTLLDVLSLLSKLILIGDYLSSWIATLIPIGRSYMEHVYFCTYMVITGQSIIHVHSALEQ